ncbi:peptide ABC transporter substrate-binding protein [Thalassobacillus devorans]|uniref:peptide ABC transporter substrate-binding protein n=1 Tax=Thalassobacillus devorans TaxID=279813 RepID=UPI00048C2BFB|nr:peptide ABC transporter substrate-binding protein [Thalassobacillus devorans]
MKKWLKSLLFALTLIVGLAGCSEESSNDSSSSEKDSSAEQEIVVNAMSEPPDLDPAMATDTTSGWIIDHTFEGLYTKDQDGKPVLGAASDVQVSDDKKTYTFTIREDAKWSDGSPVTAQDFEYAWKRVLNPETGSAFAFYMYYIKGAEAYNKGKGSVEDVGVTAKDDKTLEVEFQSPIGYVDELLTMWTFYPVKKELVKSNGQWAAKPDTYVSNGPFKLTKWNHDSEVVIKRNDNYWNKDVVNLKKVTYKMVNDATTYYQMFKSGELDLIQTLPTDVIAQEKDSEEYKVTPYFGTYMYMFNVEKEPFTNKKIRKAFNLAIDRELITKNVTKAGEKPAYSFVPPGVETPEGDFQKNAEDYYVKKDVEKAKQLLKEGMKEEGWETLPEVTLLYNTSENHKRVAEVVQEMYKQNLGVDINLSNQEWKTYLDTTKQGNFQMARMGWIGIFVDPVVILDYYLGNSPNNRTNWINEEYDNLIKQAKVEQDPAKRYELLHQAESVLMEDLPFTPIYHYTNNYLTDQSYEGIVYPVNRYPYFKWAKKVSE